MVVAFFAMTPSPELKLEASPAESYLSVPGEIYPSLFPDTSPVAVLSPISLDDADDADDADPADPDDPDDPDDLTPPPHSAHSKKRSAKKRKCWGQILPEPKTNLPPRKRAKTEDEKEQRRVERVLRNRRAAQSSRERKRVEVEALEARNAELEAMLDTVQNTNMELLQELEKFRRSSVVTAAPSPSSLSPLRDPALTLSPGLFVPCRCGLQIGQAAPSVALAGLDELAHSYEPSSTVNPASISPTPSTVPLATPALSKRVISPIPMPYHQPLALASASDLTQRPAAMLSDLQCHRSEAGSTMVLQSAQIRFFYPLIVFLQQAYLLLISSIIHSTRESRLFRTASGLKPNSFPLSTQSIWKAITWHVPAFLPSSLPSTSTLATFFLTMPSWPPGRARRRAQDRSRRTLNLALASLIRRSSLLRHLLTCSPDLARPLTDATVAALRLVSDRRVGDLVKALLPSCLSRHDRLLDRPPWLACARPDLSSKLVALVCLSLGTEEGQLRLRNRRRRVKDAAGPG